MGVLAGFSHSRARAALGAGAIVAVSIIVPSAVSPTVTANPGPPTPFDSNGFDNSFAVAQSRQQGPVIRGAAEGAQTAAAAVPPLGDPVRGTFGAQVAWPIMPIHAVLLPDGRVMSYGTEPERVTRPPTTEYDVWDPRAGTGANAHDAAAQHHADRHLLQLPDRAAQR